MKIKYFVFSALLLLATSQCSGPNKYADNQNADNDFGRQWSVIDSLDKRGRYRTAQPLAEDILNRAIAENNPAQSFKAYLYAIRLHHQLAEFGDAELLTKLDAPLNNAVFPTLNFLELARARTLQNYYDQNHWRINQRLANSESDDIREWSGSQFESAIAAGYARALKRAGQLFLTVFKDSDMLSGDSLACSAFHTGLDLIATEAIEFYLSDRANLLPVERAVDNPDLLFAPPGIFAQLKADSLPRSSWHLAIRNYQLLDELHRKNGSEYARTLLAIRRIQSMRSLVANQNADSLMVATFKKMRLETTDEMSKARLALTLAAHYERYGNQFYGAPPDSAQQHLLIEARNYCDEVLSTTNLPEVFFEEAKAVRSRIMKMQLDVSAEKFIIPGAPWKFVINHRNISECYYIVVPFDYEEYREISALRDKREQIHQIVSKARIRDLIHRVPLSGEDHFPHSIEIPQNELAEGFYVIIAAPSRVVSFERTNIVVVPLWATSISWLQRYDETRRNEFRFVERLSGEALSGLEVAVYEQNYNPYRQSAELTFLTSGKTESDGRFTVLHTEKDQRIVLKAGKEPTHVWLDQSFYQSRPHPAAPPHSRNYLFIDRAVYRPGQTLHFKGIAVTHHGDDRKIITDEPVTVTLYDANGQKVASKPLITNKFGSYSGEFLIPASGITGTFRLECGRDAKYFNVEEYKRPTFFSELNLAPGSRMPGDTIAITGQAKAFAGFPVAGARVNFRVIRAPEWPWFRGGFFPTPAGGEQISSGTTQTDAEGNFRFDFEALPSPSAASPWMQYRFTVTADVTDASGESQSAEVSFVAGKAGFTLGTNLGHTVSSNAWNNLEVMAIQPDGEPAKVSGEISLYKLRSPDGPLRERLWPTPDQFLIDETTFRSRFPNDAYGNVPNIENAAIQDTVWTGIFDTRLKEAVKNQPRSPEPGWYALRVQALDNKGQNIVSEQRFTIYNPQSDKVPSPEVLWSVMSSEEALPGDELSLVVASAVNAVVWLETEINGKITDSRQIQLNKGLTTLKIPVTEECRGNFGVHLSTVYLGRNYTVSHMVRVPFTNKQLKIELSAFRDEVLPGSKEKWKLRVSGLDGTPSRSEVMLGMYDASLDALGFNNSWAMHLFPERQLQRNWRDAGSFSWAQGWSLYIDWNELINFYRSPDCRLNWFGAEGYGRGMMKTGGVMMNADMESDAAFMQLSGVAEEEIIGLQEEGAGNSEGSGSYFANLLPRSKFNETAFFYPALNTNQTGELEFEFTLPESVTTWKWMALAHGKELESGTLEKQVVSRKPLMVIPNNPRVLREGDHFWWSCRVVNSTEDTLETDVALGFESLSDGVEIPEISAPAAKQKLELLPGETSVVRWNVRIPEGQGMVAATITAGTKSFTDGERRPFLILPEMTMITETLPLAVFKKGQSSHILNNLKNAGEEESLKNHRLTFELTTNPVWFVMKALPFLAEPAHESVQDIFSRYYANSLAAVIIRNNPAFGDALSRFLINQDGEPVSELRKSESLKYVALESTPWLAEASNQEEQMRILAKLFNEDEMKRSRDAAIAQLRAAQLPDGMWGWFSGMKANRYVTQNVLQGFGQLNKTGAEGTLDYQDPMVESAVRAIDKAFIAAMKNTDDHRRPGDIEVHYLYTRSFYPQLSAGAELKKHIDSCFDYFGKNWTDLGFNAQGMLALAAHRYNRNGLEAEILLSLEERAFYSEDKGRYWKTSPGPYWYNQGVEAHALMVELFAETGAKPEWIDEIKFWLLTQKRTQHWGNSVATANACYALLSGSADWFDSNYEPAVSVGPDELIYREGIVREHYVVVHPAPGSGSVIATWAADEITPGHAIVRIDNHEEKPLWGALYWQYFQPAHKVKSSASSPLKAKRELFVVKQEKEGQKVLPVSEINVQRGDRILVRIILETDRYLDFVHLSDQRAAGLEPVDVKSGFRFDSGQGYYLAVSDASSNFFFDRLPAGKHVIEYELRANQSGDFSAGLAKVQCMYAPAFSGHSEGARLTID